MAAKMTIVITEDDAPEGYVEVDFDIEGADMETIREDGELPAAVLLGAQMVKLADALPSVGGRPAPPKNGSTGHRSGRTH